MKQLFALSAVICLTQTWAFGDTPPLPQRHPYFYLQHKDLYVYNSDVNLAQSVNPPPLKRPRPKRVPKSLRLRCYLGVSLDNSFVSHAADSAAEEPLVDDAPPEDPALVDPREWAFRRLPLIRVTNETDPQGNTDPANDEEVHTTPWTERDSAALMLLGADLEILPTLLGNGSIVQSGLVHVEHNVPLWNPQNTRKSQSVIELVSNQLKRPEVLPPRTHPSPRRRRARGEALQGTAPPQPSLPLSFEQAGRVSFVSGQMEAWTVGTGLGLDPIKIAGSLTQQLLPADDPARVWSAQLLFSRMWPLSKTSEWTLGLQSRFDKTIPRASPAHNLVHASVQPAFSQRLSRRTEWAAAVQLGIEGENGGTQQGMLTSTLVNPHVSLSYRLTTRLTSTAEAQGGWRSNSATTETTWGILAKLIADLY